MRVVPTMSPSFKVYTGTKTTVNGSEKIVVDTGVWNDKKIEIFKHFNDKGRLAHKLYWLETIVNRIIKAKLVYFDDKGKKVKTADVNSIINT